MRIFVSSYQVNPMVTIKSPKEIDTMRAGGKLLAEILHKLALAVEPGITTQALNQLAHALCLAQRVTPTFLGYQGFPAALCVSLNDEVVHGVPSSHRRLQAGDLVGLDMGIVFQGLNVDAAITVPVLAKQSRVDWEKANPQAAQLLAVTQAALAAGVSQAKSGKTVGQISSLIQKTVEDAGFNVVRDLVGHGIGRRLHEDPQIPNYGNAKDGIVLRTGMTLAIEPMVVVGRWQLKTDVDQWTQRTADGSLAAHFEHTVAVADNGPEILTLL